VGCGPAQALLAVPNVTADPSRASVPTSYYSMWYFCHTISAIELQRVKYGIVWYSSV